jgi:hypothetical protein
MQKSLYDIYCLLDEGCMILAQDIEKLQDVLGKKRIVKSLADARADFGAARDALSNFIEKEEE